jgi:hypothetical protein
MRTEKSGAPGVEVSDEAQHTENFGALDVQLCTEPMQRLNQAAGVW